jgi:hypothetical protein
LPELWQIGIIGTCSLDAKTPQLFANLPMPPCGFFLVPSGKINRA